MKAIILTNTHFEQLTAKLDDLKESINKQASNTDVMLVVDNAEFMKRMSISKRTAQNWRDTGKIAFSQIGSKIYYKLSDIESLLENNLNPSSNKWL